MKSTLYVVYIWNFKIPNIVPCQIKRTDFHFGEGIVIATTVVPGVAICPNHLNTGIDRTAITIAFASIPSLEKSTVSKRSKY